MSGSRQLHGKEEEADCNVRWCHPKLQRTSECLTHGEDTGVVTCMLTKYQTSLTVTHYTR